MAASQDQIMDTYDIGLGNPDDKDFNTIVLSELDVVFPLEMDLDGDPLQDDEVRLCSEGGEYDEVLTVSHPDVTPDAEKSLLYYRFRWVTPGVYTLMVRVAGEWHVLSRGILVSAKGAYLGSQQLGEALPSEGMAEAMERVNLTNEDTDTGRVDDEEGAST